MKSIRIYFFSLTMFCLISICSGSQSFGQERLNLSAGFGYPDFLNLGVRYQLEQSQIAVAFGFLQNTEENLISVSGEYFLHLDGSSDLSERLPWYARAGIVYLHSETEFYIRNSFWLSSRLGREMNLSEKFGIQADFGTMFRLSYDAKIKETGGGWDFGTLIPILPCFGFGLFYRL